MSEKTAATRRGDFGVSAPAAGIVQKVLEICCHGLGCLGATCDMIYMRNADMRRGKARHGAQIVGVIKPDDSGEIWVEHPELTTEREIDSFFAEAFLRRRNLKIRRIKHGKR